jgi:hypothetical protein
LASPHCLSFLDEYLSVDTKKQKKRIINDNVILASFKLQLNMYNNIRFFFPFSPLLDVRDWRIYEILFLYAK